MAFLATPDTSLGAKVSGHAWYVVVALLTVSILGYVDRLILSFLIEPIKHDLVLSDTEVGLIAGLAFALLYVFAGIPIGRLIDTRRRVTVLAVCVLIWSVATAASGLAVGFLSLFVARIGVGAGEAAVGPAAISLVGDYFPPDKVQRPLGIFTVGLYAGGGFALILGGQLIAYLTGLGEVDLPFLGRTSAWRMTFLLLGLPGLLVAALLTATVREPLRRHHAESVDQQGAVAFFNQHRKLLLLTMFSVIMWGFNGYGLLNWYPAMLMRSYGLSTHDVAWTYGPAFLLGGTLGSLGLAPLTRLVAARGRSDAVFVVSLFSMTLMGVSSFVGPLMPSVAGVLVVSFFNLFGSSMTVAGVYAIITTVAPGRLRGLYTGVYMSVMNITGGAFGAVIVGLLTDHVFGDAGVNLALMSVAVVFAPVASLLMYLAGREYRRAPPIV